MQHTWHYYSAYLCNNDTNLHSTSETHKAITSKIAATTNEAMHFHQDDSTKAHILDVSQLGTFPREVSFPDFQALVKAIKQYSSQYLDSFSHNYVNV